MQIQNNLETLAELEGINLTKEHLIIIDFTQQFYQEFNIIPSTRALINYIKLQPNSLAIDSLLLAKLFPKGISQICKIAQLPISPRCL